MHPLGFTYVNLSHDHQSHDMRLPQNQLEHSRYAHIPVGNFYSDAVVYAADVFYSRHLARHNHVIWATPTDQPDLGGMLVFVKPVTLTSCTVLHH